ncbi:MAG: hypothetical protein LBD41_00145 [Clostridiales Family XIII bacterium]|nr:hypothetical protein [Clostridiales Family XIII bacterium]
MKNNKGSLFVDIVICLPIFIIAMVSLTYLITSVKISENIMHSLSDEGRKIAYEERSIITSVLSKTNYKNDIKNRIAGENQNKISDISVSRISVPSFLSVSDKLVLLKTSYKIPINLPIKMLSSIKSSESVLFRKFVGKSNNGKKMPFSEMEENVESNKVWVFPRAGEKYHKQDCFYIANKPREMIFTMNISNNYKPCKLCSPTVPYGALIYCFVKTGEIYHIGSCAQVEKYVISMAREEAKKRGYGACLKCGG